MNFGKMFTTIDTHVAGEAFRIVTNSSIKLHGENIQLRMMLWHMGSKMRKNYY